MRRTGTVLSALLFLLMPLLLVTAQAIRLPRESAASSSNHIGKLQQEEDNNWVGAYHSVNGEVVLCRDGYCSGAGGSSRKLMMSTNTISSTPESTKGERVEKKPTPSHHVSQQGFDKKQEDFSVKPTHTETTTTTTTKLYPDVFDLAGMDYSPAKRKPPIHN